MDWYLLAAFLAASAFVVVTPGPVMAIIAHNTLRHGTAVGLLTALGIGLGEVCLFGAMFLSLTMFDGLVRQLFRWLALAGALYLAWLAARALRCHCRPSHRDRPSRMRRPVVDGLTVALGNPAALLFYMAFFMPFVDPDRPVARQMAVLGAMYLCTALSFDFACVLTLARLRPAANWMRLGGIAELVTAAVYLLIAAIAVAGFLGASV